MKKLAVVVLALVTMISLSAVAQYGSSDNSMKKDDTAKKDKAAKSDKKAAASADAKDIVGTIGKDGTTFVSDKDKKKTWKIVNPEAVKGHEGHHAKVNAHVYPDKGEIHVMSVSMNLGTEKAGKKDDMKKDEMKH
ncbi:MAG: hypothetical protein ACR2IF_10320 [Terriglobales bacterium]